jgi:septal ring factor EnvC (AmiA/AmiB activator)
MTVSEKIVQSTLLQAVARVAMALTLPILLMGVGYLSAMGTTVNAHTTNIALLQQEDAAINRRLDQYEKQADDILTLLQSLNTDSATTKRDVGYLRDWVEELKRGQKAFQ